MAATNIASENTSTLVRRSANYDPPKWDYDYIQALSSKYMEESYVKRRDMLKEKVRMILTTTQDPLEQFELIDLLERLGLSYHFEDEIKKILENIYTKSVADQKDAWNYENNLYAIALQFRIFRLHGFTVSTEVFYDFQDEKGNFKECITEDVEGMLSLLEASILSVEGETILDEARNFTSKHLKEIVIKNESKDHMPLLIERSLEFPLHWRTPRLEARWFIDIYERKHNNNPMLLEFAKLDFNIVQAIHQEEIKEASRWWKSLGLPKKLSFARDRLMENYFWHPGLTSDPQFGHFRIISTKLYVIMTMIDDAYDVYGTLEELELFTEAVRRWDITYAMEKLPDYMKILFLAHHNTVNELVYEALRDHGFNVMDCIKKYWGEYCESYMIEARRYYGGCTPTQEEYIENGYTSIGIPVAMLHTYFAVANPITKEALDCFQQQCPSLIRWSATIIRYADDLGTFSREVEIGDTSNSVQFYMHETGASEEEARKHIRFLMDGIWKKLNKDMIDCSPFCRSFMEIPLNFARMVNRLYQHGDGHSSQKDDVEELITSILAEPIPLD